MSGYNKEVGAICETLANADNEATAAPYWLILDPKQNMSCNVHGLAGQISGPFFCREDAQEYLKDRRHAFSQKAVVYCHSGHHSRKYELLCRKLNV
jgi:hypothetical protein